MLAALLALDGGDLLEAGNVAPSLELGRQEGIDDRERQLDAEHPGAKGEHVRVVMEAGEPGGEVVMAQRRAHAVHLVRCDLLALATATEHDGAVRPSGDDLPGGGGTERWV